MKTQDLLPLNKAKDFKNEINQGAFASSEITKKILHDCKKIVGCEIFDKWFSQLKQECTTVNEVIFLAPSKFVRDWLNREFFRKKDFLSALRLINPQLIKVSAVFIAEKSSESLSANISDRDLISNRTLSDDKSNSKSSQILNLSKFDNVFAYGTELNPRFTFENFIPAKFNKIALSMAKIVANCDESPRLFEDKIPLFIHGAVGMGKTHLAQAIAWQIRQDNKGTKTVYLSAEKFMFHFVRSLRGNQIMDFKEKMRSIDVLIVDDVQFIAGKENTQQEFMNCFNSLVEDNKQVILVCDRCPNDLENIDEKLKSRIAGGMIVNFKSPDYSDRILLLKGKAANLKFEISSDILQFLAQNIRGSVRDLEGAIKKLFAEKIIGGQEINLEFTRSILNSYIRKDSNIECSVERIQKFVAEYYELKLSDLCSANRTRANVKARQIAMYLSKTKTNESLAMIGQKFGGRNHATVIHSVKTISNLIVICQKTANEIELIEAKLNQN